MKGTLNITDALNEYYKTPFPCKEGNCSSTHGGAGYAAFSYWDGQDIICGGCGFRITNPPPTGSRFVPRTFSEWLKGKKRKEYPLWPDWIPRLIKPAEKTNIF